jgi:hypothetical protein
MGRARWWMAVVTAVLLVTACSSSSGTSPETTDGPVSSTSTDPVVTSTTSSPSTTSTTLGPSTTIDPGGGTPSTSTSTSTIPSEFVAGPVPGSKWAVVGVTYDDRLNVRSTAGVGGSIVASFEPTMSDVTATGDALLVGDGVWWAITAGMVEGWVNSWYLGALGDTDEVASWVNDRLGGIPTAPSMAGLAEIVSETRAEGADDVRVVTVAAADDSGDIGEVTVDVFMDGDDSIRGERLVVFGQRMTAGGDYSLYAVEATPICWRGVDTAGLCV